MWKVTRPPRAMHRACASASRRTTRRGWSCPTARCCPDLCRSEFCFSGLSSSFPSLSRIRSSSPFCRRGPRVGVSDAGARAGRRLAYCWGSVLMARSPGGAVRPFPARRHTGRFAKDQRHSALQEACKRLNNLTKGSRHCRDKAIERFTTVGCPKPSSRKTKAPISAETGQAWLLPRTAAAPTE